MALCLDDVYPIPHTVPFCSLVGNFPRCQMPLMVTTSRFLAGLGNCCPSHHMPPDWDNGLQSIAVCVEQMNFSLFVSFVNHIPDGRNSYF